VRAAIAVANVHQPAGNIDGPRQNYTLATNDQLTDAAGFRAIVLAYRNGAPVRLRDVAPSSTPRRTSSSRGGPTGSARDPQRAAAARRQHHRGRRPRQGAAPAAPRRAPQGVEVAVVSDRTETIRASVEDVEFTLVLTIGLVVLVIFVFLRNLRATIIPGVAVPLSLVGTFGVMYAARLQPRTTCR
jgi:multidrug efflux pump